MDDSAWKVTNEPLAWTSTEAAAALQLCDKTVLKLAKAGALPGRKIGRLWRFSPDALRDWLADQGPPLNEEPHRAGKLGGANGRPLSDEQTT